MYSTPVLAVPDFSKPFVLECESLGIGLGIVLTQEGRPIVFTSKKLCDHNFGNSTYEDEMMAILHEMHTWNPYLLRNYFQIKIDDHIFKYFLE